jgi:hypothetical protein
VTGEEVEQVFLNRARFEFEERGDIMGEDLYRAIAKKKRVATDKLVNRWLEEKAS